ncbi:hypothetical protein [Singulisphaera sp. PoT]|uniref:hypothetical protein n=1 Tax=Singulisphaera sp. PoT TaxID=3411797 RepID=UPI003BF554AC
MRASANRREFLEVASASIGAASLAATAAPAPAVAADGKPRMKLAALASVYYYLSHAYHIVGRFLDGFPVHDGRGLHRPDFDIASLFIEQVIPQTDLGRAKAAKHNVRLSESIADALTLGTGKLAVDGVLLIAEHGDYPYNDKFQKLYPRGRYFREVLDVFKASGQSVPVFIDKHLSYNRKEAQGMYDQAKAMNVPLMAGSSLPVTWRLPELEIPLGQPWKEAIVASRGDLEIFGFHALETLQCMVERRDRKGKPQGVAAVTCLEGDAVWEAGSQGVWSPTLLDEALSRSHTLNPGDMRQNTLDFMPPAGKDHITKFRKPIAFVVEYVDGFKATAMILNGHVDDTTFAGRLDKPSDDLVSTLVYLPAPPGANFFNPLVLRIEDFFKAKKPPYPVERTLLTGGILDVALESRIRGHQRLLTPDLATIDYEAPADSGYIRTPVANARANRT